MADKTQKQNGDTGQSKRGRPTKAADDRRITKAVEPPADLIPAARALWSEQFGRFPPGYFVPADLPAMVSYLLHLLRLAIVADKYDTAEATDKGADKALRSHFIAMQQLTIRMQNNLRFWPSNRTLKEVHGVLANDPTKQTNQAGGDNWRGLFAVVPDKKS